MIAFSCRFMSGIACISPVEARFLVREHVAVVVDDVARFGRFDAGPVAGDWAGRRSRAFRAATVLNISA